MAVNKAYTSMLPTASDLEGALFNVSEVNAESDTGYESKKATIEEVGSNIVNDIEWQTDLTETTSKTITGAINELSEKIGEISGEVWGVEVDYENSRFIRLGGAVGRSGGVDFDEFLPWQRRRCNVADDGTVNAYYGEAGYTDDGSNGQVMVEQPPFYYKVIPIKTSPNTDSGIGYHLLKARYFISATPKSGYKLHPAFYGEARPIYLSAYEGSLYDSALDRMYDDDSDTSTTLNAGDLLCSIGNNQKPISGLYKVMTKPNMELVASRRGNGWHLETVQVHQMNVLLMLVEYASLNSKTAIGQGVAFITNSSSFYNCSSLTGSTSSLENASGQASSTINRQGATETTETANGKTSISYRGQENEWGNLWRHLQSINFWGDRTMAGGQAYVNPTLADFDESTKSNPYIVTQMTLPNASGYIKYFGYSESFDWLFLPSMVGGTSSIPVGDHIYVTASLNDYRIALMGGNWNGSNYVGSLYWLCSNGIDYRSRGIGGRLMYIPSVS